MFTNQTTFIAGLVKKGELKKASNENSYLSLNLAKNYSIKDGNDWVELNPIYVRVTLWGKEAELFDASNIPPGTPLLISGRIVGERSAPYQNNQGIQVPSEDREQIIVDAIAPLIGRGRKVDVSMANGSNGGTRQSQTQQRQSAQTSNDLFGTSNSTSSTDLFGSSTSTSSEDLFDDIFS